MTDTTVRTAAGELRVSADSDGRFLPEERAAEVAAAIATLVRS